MTFLVAGRPFWSQDEFGGHFGVNPLQVGDRGMILRLDESGNWTLANNMGPRLFAIWGSGGAGDPRWAVGCANPESPQAAALRFKDGLA